MALCYPYVALGRRDPHEFHMDNSVGQEGEEEADMSVAVAVEARILVLARAMALGLLVPAGLAPVCSLVLDLSCPAIFWQMSC